MVDEVDAVLDAVSLLSRRPYTLEELAAALGLTRPDALDLLNRLLTHGLVSWRCDGDDIQVEVRAGRHPWTGLRDAQGQHATWRARLESSEQIPAVLPAEGDLARRMLALKPAVMGQRQLLLEVEWELENGSSNLGKGDLVLWDGRHRFAVVELKDIPLGSGSTTRTKRTKARGRVRDQALKYTDALRARLPLDSAVLGFSFTNEDDAPRLRGCTPEGTMDAAIQAMWPGRKHRELLLDLGERKAWTAEHYHAALGRMGRWFEGQGMLPDAWGCTLDQEVQASDRVRALLEIVEPAPDPDGVGVSKRIAAVAREVGSTSAKTLANSLSRGLQDHRPDHRWLRLLARVVALGERDVPGLLDGILYHRRCLSSVSATLAGTTQRSLAGEPDAADALLVASLVALWQRRRPTQEARGNRGQAAPRRATPKPVVALSDTIMMPGQLAPLVQRADALVPSAAQALVAVALEAAMTAAHMKPHPGRRGEEPASDSWSGSISQALRNPIVHRSLDPVDLAMFQWRHARMEGWRRGQPMPAPPDLVREHPHALAVSALDRAHRTGDDGPASDLPRTSEVGMLMLLPQLRARGWDFQG